MENLPLKADVKEESSWSIHYFNSFDFNIVFTQQQEACVEDRNKVSFGNMPVNPLVKFGSDNSQDYYIEVSEKECDSDKEVSKEKQINQVKERIGEAERIHKGEKIVKEEVEMKVKIEIME